MSTQRHIIRRQLIELKVNGNPEEAQKLQGKVGRVYRQSVLPLIEKYCSELSQPDRLHRVETLEIDIGHLDADQLEEQLLEKLTPELWDALFEQISSQEHDTTQATQQETSQLELLAFFARTGCLPWWADASQPKYLEQSLAFLIKNLPQQLRHLMRELILEVRPLQRIVRSFPSDQLAQLAATLAPELRTSLLRDPVNLMAVLQKTYSTAQWGTKQIGYLVWIHTLQVAGLNAESNQSTATFYKGILTRVAAELGLTYSALLDGIQQGETSSRSSLHPEFKAALEPTRQTSDAETHTLPELLASLQVSRESYTPLWVALSRLAPYLSVRLQEQLLFSLEEWENNTALNEGLSQNTAIRILRILQTGLIEQKAPTVLGTHHTNDDPQSMAQLRQDISSAWDQLISATGKAPNAFAHLIQSLQSMFPEIAKVGGHPSIQGADQTGDGGRVHTHARPSDHAKLLPPAAKFSNNQGYALSPSANRVKAADLSFSDSEAIYINNAGLVILWPFLRRIFANLGLLEEGLFHQPSTRQRGVGLLQHLATGKPPLLEYLLPLNKVLCGMALNDVFDFGPQLLPDEEQECNDLLHAVIDQAPILGEMSLEGLRGTFLLRPGVLSGSDGSWLLQVERETYDIVLERFPWSWEWVKLPWMEAPLRVEW
jgi:hypothetical protein